MVLSFEGISHVLLDIEGTTCPVSFVSGTLFPYARTHLGNYLERHGSDPAVQTLVQEVRRLWLEDPDPEARALLQASDQTEGSKGAHGSADKTVAPGLQPPPGERIAVVSVEPYLQWLIRKDRKVTALKDLQGRIWQEGYAEGELQGPLYADVPEALRRWSEQGLVLAVYSSGSVAAQQLLYAHSSAGDLRPFFHHWFDTRSGAKQDAASYHSISRAMEADPGAILFVSDAPAELDAAAEAGYQVLFSHRPGNPHQSGGGHPSTSSYAAVQISRPPR